MSTSKTSVEEQKGLNPKLDIRDSKIQGKGIFTKVPFKKGDRIWVTNLPEQSSVIMDDEEFAAFRKRCTEEGKEWDAVAIGDGKHRVGIVSRDEDPSNYGNHSCGPNTAPADDGNRVALRNIEAEEELTIDYGQFSEVGWEMICNCGSKNCKGTVKGRVA